jgi:hypothetical protein
MTVSAKEKLIEEVAGKVEPSPLSFLSGAG